MNFLERQLPLLRMIINGIRARALTPHMVTIRPEIRAAQASARATEPTKIDPDSIPDSAVLQIQLYRQNNLHFKPVDADVAKVELAENEVLFAPQSSIINKYILFYNTVYLPLDIGSIIDPQGTLNERFVKAIPAWCVCSVIRSKHPDVREGSTFHGFFPIAPYSVRRLEAVDVKQGTALQCAPGFKGPLEWLRLVQTDGYSDFIADLFEYFKIGITYARQLEDLGFYGAEQLVFSSASSTSAQIIAMCVKELNPGFRIIGLTSPRNFEMVRNMSYFDDVYRYDDVASSDGASASLYFDALGDESVSVAALTHFAVRRWWLYGQGGDDSLSRLLKINRKGSMYSNGIDSFTYANRHGISDADILTQAEAINQKHDLEQHWGTGYRTISSARELYDLYQAFTSNTHPSGERVRYVSPVLKGL